MLRRSEDLSHAALFHQATVTHHRDLIGEVFDHREIMGDEEVAGAVLCLESG